MKKKFISLLLILNLILPTVYCDIIKDHSNRTNNTPQTLKMRSIFTEQQIGQIIKDMQKSFLSKGREKMQKVFLSQEEQTNLLSKISNIRKQWKGRIAGSSFRFICSLVDIKFFMPNANMYDLKFFRRDRKIGFIEITEANDIYFYDRICIFTEKAKIAPMTKKDFEFLLKNNCKEAIEVLAKRKNFNNKIDSYGRTPLYMAVKHNKYEAARILLENGADPNKMLGKGNEKFTVLYTAVKERSNRMVKLLFEHGADPTLCKRNAFKLALKNNALGIIYLFFRYNKCFLKESIEWYSKDKSLEEEVEVYRVKMMESYFGYKGELKSDGTTLLNIQLYLDFGTQVVGIFPQFKRLKEKLKNREYIYNYLRLQYFLRASERVKKTVKLMGFFYGTVEEKQLKILDRHVFSKLENDNERIYIIQNAIEYIEEMKLILNDKGMNELINRIKIECELFTENKKACIDEAEQILKTCKERENNVYDRQAILEDLITIKRKIRFKRDLYKKIKTEITHIKKEKREVVEAIIGGDIIGVNEANINFEYNNKRMMYYALNYVLKKAKKSKKKHKIKTFRNNPLIKKLLALNPDLDAKSKKGLTLFLHMIKDLMKAEEDKNLYYIALQDLINLEVDINAHDTNNTTALTLAYTKNDDSLWDLLLAQDSLDITQIYKHGFTPLHLQVRSNDIDKVSELLRKGEEINQEDNKGITPLMLAMKKGLEPIVKEMLKERSDIPFADEWYNILVELDLEEESNRSMIKDLFEHLIKYKNDEFMRKVVLIKKDKQPGDQKNLPFDFFMKNIFYKDITKESKEILRIVTQKFLDKEQRNMLTSLLFQAIKRDKLGIADFLLRNGAKVSYVLNMYSLVIEKRLENECYFDKLIKITKRGSKLQKLLQICLKLEMLELYFLEEDYRENIEHIYEQYHNLAELIVEYEGEKISISERLTTEINIKTFGYMVKYKHFSLVKCFLDMLRDNNAQDFLMACLSNKEFELAKFLVDNEIADVNGCLSRHKARCPLREAVLQGDNELVVKLLKLGSDINKKNEVGVTVLEEALEFYTVIAQALAEDKKSVLHQKFGEAKLEEFLHKYKNIFFTLCKRQIDVNKKIPIGIIERMTNPRNRFEEQLLGEYILKFKDTNALITYLRKEKSFWALIKASGQDASNEESPEKLLDIFIGERESFIDKELKNLLICCLGLEIDHGKDWGLQAVLDMQKVLIEGYEKSVLGDNRIVSTIEDPDDEEIIERFEGDKFELKIKYDRDGVVKQIDLIKVIRPSRYPSNRSLLKKEVEIINLFPVPKFMQKRLRDVLWKIFRYINNSDLTIKEAKKLLIAA